MKIFGRRAGLPRRERDLADDARAGTWHRWLGSVRHVAGLTAGRIAQVGPQGMEAARKAGRSLAAQVIAVQRAAHLPEHLMRKSAESVITPRAEARPGDAAWRDGYREVAAEAVWGPPPEPPEPPDWGGWTSGPDGLEPPGGGGPPEWPQPRAWPNVDPREPADLEAGA
jgi:hypothetical protein